MEVKMDYNITVEDLQVSYVGNTALEDVCFSYGAGRLIGVLGPNGAGKSTMLKAMLGLIPKDSGRITIAGQPVDKVRKEIAYIPHRSNIDWDFPIVVKNAVLSGTFPKMGLFRRPKASDRERAMECLEKVGMEAFADRQIGELSGGQQQRVFMARALAQDAELFFLDEPFVGIDVSSEEIIINMLKDLRDQGKIVVVVHHDLSKVSDHFSHVLLLNKALGASGPVAEVFNTENLSVAYQHTMAVNYGMEVPA